MICIILPDKSKYSISKEILSNILLQISPLTNFDSNRNINFNKLKFNESKFLEPTDPKVFEEKLLVMNWECDTILWSDLFSNIKNTYNKDILSNLRTRIIIFIIEYYTLYYDRRELDAPLYDFSHRNIKTLFDISEYPIFKKLLDNEINEIKILSEAGNVSEILRMKILHKKIAAIIALKLKDKTPRVIHDMIMSEH